MSSKNPENKEKSDIVPAVEKAVKDNKEDEKTDLVNTIILFSFFFLLFFISVILFLNFCQEKISNLQCY